MFGPDEKCTIPDPNDYRLARLRDGASIMSDGCNQARHMQSVMKDFIQQDYMKQLGGSEADNFAEGKAKWNAMSEAERNESVRVYIVTCQNHLRNTFIRHGIKFEKEFLGEVLEECLEDFDRRSVLRWTRRQFAACSSQGHGSWARSRGRVEACVSAGRARMRAAR